jgi:hypothetical protein
MRNLLLSMFLIGCSHTLPPEPAISQTYRDCKQTDTGNPVCKKVTTTYDDNHTVTVSKLLHTQVHGKTVSMEIIQDTPVAVEKFDDFETPLPIEDSIPTIQADMENKDKLRKAIEEAVAKDSCVCAKGDPLCPCL